MANHSARHSGTGRVPSEIDSVLRGASGRIFLTRLLRALAVALTWAAGVLALALIAQRVFAFPVDWRTAWWVALGSASLGALLYVIITTPSRSEIARRVDDAAGLRESISTALIVNSSKDAWSVAAVETARERAKSVRLHDAMPVRAPRNWWAPFAPAAAFALAWFLMPQWDVLGAIQEKQREQERQIELVSAKTQVEEAERAVEARLREMGLEKAMPDEAPDANAPEPTTPAEVRRSAIRKMTALRDELAKLKESPANMAAEQMKERLSQLRQPGPGPLNEMISKMQRGDLQGAREALEKIQQQLNNNEMSPEQREALEKQMESLSKQLEDLAEKTDELREALEKAGMDPDLAKDLQALQEALEKNPQKLTPEQLEKLKQIAQAMAQSQSQCENLGAMAGQGAAGLSSMSNALAGMAAQGAQAAAAGEALDELMKQLGELAKQGEMTDLMAMLGQCQSCGGQCNASGQCMNPSCAGVGGQKAGVGHRIGTPEEHNQSFGTKLEQAAGQGKDGPVIARSYIEGMQIRGESKAEFRAVAVAAESAAAEAIDERRVPREHQDAVKRYFGRLKRAIEGQSTPEPAPAASETTGSGG